MTLGPVAAREYYWLLSPRTAEARRNVERLFSNLAATLDKELPNYSRP
jgi:hypothetical protein